MSRRPTDHIVPRATDTVIVLGEFDGVHRSHGALLTSALRLARPRRAVVVAVVADGGAGVPRIMSVHRRCELLLSCGVSSAFVAPLPRPVDVQAAVGPAIERMRPIAIFIDRESWPAQPRDALSDYLQRIGATVRDGPSDRGPAPIDALTIIDHIRDGDIRSAEEMLGRPYELSGAVAPRVRAPVPTWFQTERLVPAADTVLPRNGVYAARTLIGRRWFEAAVNVGTRPGLGSSDDIVIEGHLIEFEGDLRDTELRLRLVRRLRDELHFSGPAELAAQTERDVIEVTAVLRSKT